MNGSAEGAPVTGIGSSAVDVEAVAALFGDHENALGTVSVLVQPLDTEKHTSSERRLADIDGLLPPMLANLSEKDRERFNIALCQAIDEDRDYNEIFRISPGNDDQRWVRSLGRTVTSGDLSKFVGVTYDITAERELLAQREMMIREMNHRVKNLFAIISAMITISVRETKDIEIFAENLRARIHALGRSHALTSDQGEEITTTLDTLIDTVVTPTLSSQKLETEGADTPIAVSQITSLALIFHEWATNATKYGALSVEDGSILVSCARDGDLTQIVWEERGKCDDYNEGRGFGTRLIEATARQLRGEISGEATDAGYRRTLTFEME